MSKATPIEYKEVLAEAEAAVASVKDPELKRVAFERILDRLLAGPQIALSSHNPSPRKPHRTVNRQTAELRRKQLRGGPKAYVQEMIDDGFFKKPQTIANVRAELGNRGHHIAVTSLSGPLQKLCQDKLLRRQKGTGNGEKATFVYSDW